MTVPEPGATVDLGGVSAAARWLRDHGDDPGSVDPRSGQRAVDTFAIPRDVVAAAVTEDDTTATVRWSDGATTRHDLAALRVLLADPRTPRPTTGLPLTLDTSVEPWAEPGDPSRLDAAVIGSEGWLEALRRLRSAGWVMFDGAAPDRSTLERVATRIGYPRRTIFGDVWTMAPGADEHLDSAYDTVGLDVHTDGTYSHDAPGVIAFLQQAREGTGGESVLVDGFAAARDFAAAEPEAADLLRRFEIRGHYREPGVHLVAERPVLRTDGAGVLRQVSFNNYDRAPLLPADGWADAVIDAYAAFRAVITEPRRSLRLEWQPGRLLLVDNWRLLHGRRSYRGTRTFIGMYTNHEDLESAWRLAAI